jgi:DNA-binding CsgD family transcriptional regulator
MGNRHGPTVREEQILALREAGREIGEIAAALGVSEGYIKNVLQRLLHAGESRTFEKMVARGSAALLAALCSYHPDVAIAAGRSPETG